MVSLLAKALGVWVISGGDVVTAGLVCTNVEGSNPLAGSAAAGAVDAEPALGLEISPAIGAV